MGTETAGTAGIGMMAGADTTVIADTEAMTEAMTEATTEDTTEDTTMTAGTEGTTAMMVFGDTIAVVMTEAAMTAAATTGAVVTTGAATTEETTADGMTSIAVMDIEITSEAGQTEEITATDLPGRPDTLRTARRSERDAEQRRGAALLREG